jgi:tetratricopeptide (TPR) repeat protein
MNEQLNKRLLTQIVAVSVVLAAGVFLLNRIQVRRSAPELRALAQAAQSQGRPDRAARLLSQYLSFAPGDTEARAEYGSLLETTSDTPAARREAIAAFEAILLDDPGRTDIRKRVVALRIERQEYEEALGSLELLRQATPDDADVAFQSGLCLEARLEYPLAVKEYRHAIKIAPAGLAAYVRLAQLLRRRLNDPVAADNTIDQMVAANPKVFQVYLFRAKHRRELKAPGTEEDLQRARELAPEDAEVLLFSAEWEKENGRLANARRYLQKVLEKQPVDERADRALILLEIEAGEGAQAVFHLREALTRFPGNADLLSALAALLTQRRDIAGARAVITEMRRWKIAPPHVALLQAETDMAEGKWQEAREALEANRPLLTFGPGKQLSRAELLLGQCYKQLGETDLELSAVSRACRAAPEDADAQFALTEVLVRLGRLTEAVSRRRKISGDSANTPEALFEYAKLLVLERLSSSSRVDQWQEAEQALDKAAEKMPRAAAIDLLRAEILAAQNKVVEAQRLLEATALRHPKAVDVPVALATLASRQGKPAAAKAILDAAEMRIGTNVDLCLARLQLAVTLAEARSSGAVSAAENQLAAVEGEDLVRLTQGLAESHFRWQNFPEARRLLLKVADLIPQDLPVRLRLFDLAAQMHDDSLMERMVGEIKRLESGDGPLGHYGEAVLLLTRAGSGTLDGLEIARRHLVTAASQRPTWPAVATAKGMIAELQGRADEALAEYLRALEMGESRMPVARQVVQMLYQRQRYVEADMLIQRLQPEGLLSPELRKLAAEISLRNADPRRALELAVAAVPPDSKDAQDHIWLSQVMLAVGRNAEAGVSLQRAVELAGGSGAPWIALVHYYLRQGNKPKAEEVIGEARIKLKGPEARPTIAQCYELIGKREVAETEYRSALEAAPKDSKVLHHLASFYDRSPSSAEAISGLRHLLHLEAQLPRDEAAWIRRALATRLAAETDYSLFQEALHLIDCNLSSVATSSADVFTKVQILATRSEHLPEAVELLQQLALKDRLPPEQEYYLARMYAACGKWPEARKTMMKVFSREDSNPAYLGFFVDQLLQNGEMTEAGVWLRRLERIAPVNPETVSLRARALVKGGKSQQAVSLVQSYIQDTPSAKEGPVQRLRFGAQLIERLGHEVPVGSEALLAKTAEETYRRAVDQSTQPEDLLALAEYLGRRHRFAEALRLCEEVKVKGPALALAAAMAATRIVCAGPASERQLEDVERSLLESSKGMKESSSWNSLLAVLQARRGRYADAERLYRLVLNENDRDVDSLNNLALLLVCQDSPSKEALGLVEKAIALVGPRADLLDTRGVVYLHDGRADSALRDLAAASSRNASPVHYFHIAQAYHRIGKQAEAKVMMQKAAATHVERSLILPIEQVSYRRLLRDLDLQEGG